MYGYKSCHTHHFRYCAHPNTPATLKKALVGENIPLRATHGTATSFSTNDKNTQ